ncbi:NUDIX domain-containing protein [Desulfitobacterium sp. AusDCA]|uniref:NUDIX domain-containing protein n=1 Tax=Desulfitobacterium sp. AusDCA TaxID=3240383 RepID=UPI003DA78E5B
MTQKNATPLNLREEGLSQETVFKGRLLHINRDTVRLPNGAEATREVVRHPGAVAIVALAGDDLLLVKQYRYPIDQETLEIPAGKLEPGETPEICAQRELREETGYRGRLDYIGKFYSTPGFSDEIVHLFSAEELIWAPLTADDDEFLSVERISWTDALRQAKNGNFSDAKTTLGILMLAGKKE